MGFLSLKGAVWQMLFDSAIQLFWDYILSHADISLQSCSSQCDDDGDDDDSRSSLALVNALHVY